MKQVESSLENVRNIPSEQRITALAPAGHLSASLPEQTTSCKTTGRQYSHPYGKILLRSNFKMFIFVPGSLYISVNCHDTVKHKIHQLQSLQIPTSVISCCSIISRRKLSRNQVAIASPALSTEAIRGRNFSYVRCLLW